MTQPGRILLRYSKASPTPGDMFEMAGRIRHKLEGQVCGLANRRQQSLSSTQTFQQTGDGSPVVGPALDTGKHNTLRNIKACWAAVASC
jgi:hypothetical protein